MLDNFSFTNFSPPMFQLDTLANPVSGILKQMEKDGSIPTPLYLRIRPSASQPPRIYRLPKVHKDNVPVIQTQNHLTVSSCRKNRFLC